MTVDPRFYNEILPRLWRGGSHGYYWSNDDGEGKKVTIWHTLAGGAGKVPSVWAKTMDCYFSVHPSKVRKDQWHRSTLEDVECINCLYAEIDGLTDEHQVQEALDFFLTLPHRPTLINYSGGGLHGYWFLSETFQINTEDDFARATLAQRAIVSYIGGDPTVHDLARILRVPGTINHKPERNGAEVKILHFELDDQYALEDLEGMCVEQIEALRDFDKNGANAMPEEPTNLEDKEAWDALYSSRNGQMYRGLFDGDLSYASDDHSRADLLLCGGLAWVTGRNIGQMDRMFRQSGLMRDKWLRDDYRGETLNKAASTAQKVYDPQMARAKAAGQAAVNSGSSANTNGASPNEAQPLPSRPWYNSFPYFEDKGCIWIEGEDAKGNPWEKEIAEFTATITHEVTTEGGERLFTIEGEGKRGGAYTVTIPAETIGEPRRLLAILEGVVGALDPVRAGMSAHLAPAIKKLTDQSILKRVRRYSRTGWRGNSFLIPGREPKDSEIILHGKLVYSLGAQCDPQLATDALTSLIECANPERSTVALSYVLTGPLAHIAGWDDERYILMVRGESGTFKTSIAQALMCIWGGAFIKDANLLKLGEGVTRNALIAIATQAHDMPMFVDNYKPNTDPNNTFVSLIHNILEGGEKERLTRMSQLRETKPLNCWPLITGEDVPETDAAAIARVLILQFDTSVRANSTILSSAQSLSSHLPYIGATWLDWIESDDGKLAIAPIAAEMAHTRTRWATLLASLQPDMINPMRVATNLAINELAFRIACQHPLWGNILSVYQAQHMSGLLQIANRMADSTVETAEVMRFLSAIRDLVAAGTALLPEKGTSLATIDRGRVVGWRDTDGSVYIIPKVAMAFAERNLGVKFNSTTQIANQLEGRKMLQSRDSDKRTRKVRFGADLVNVWHITKAGFDA